MLMEDPYSGNCKRHGPWTARYCDECPKCQEEDILQSEADYWNSFGICLGCHWCDPESSYHMCQHPNRKEYPTKPRKRKCKYFERPKPPA